MQVRYYPPNLCCTRDGIGVNFTPKQRDGTAASFPLRWSLLLCFVFISSQRPAASSEIEAGAYHSMRLACAFKIPTGYQKLDPQEEQAVGTAMQQTFPHPTTDPNPNRPLEYFRTKTSAVPSTTHAPVFCISRTELPPALHGQPFSACRSYFQEALRKDGFPTEQLSCTTVTAGQSTALRTDLILKARPPVGTTALTLIMIPGRVHAWTIGFSYDATDKVRMERDLAGILSDFSVLEKELPTTAPAASIPITEDAVEESDGNARILYWTIGCFFIGLVLPRIYRWCTRR